MSRKEGVPGSHDASHKVAEPAVTPSEHEDAVALSARHRQFGVLLEYSPDAIIIVDQDGAVSEWNPAAEVLLGTKRQTALGEPFRDLFFPPHGEHFITAWQQLLAGEIAPRFEIQWSRGGGPNQKLSVIIAPIRHRESLAGAVMILRTLSASGIEAGSLLERGVGTPSPNMRPASAEAERDGPGGLPGRGWLQRHLSAPPVTGLERGIAVFDIDVFDLVKATYGPDAADGVLSDFAALLLSLDTPGHFAHLRDDVFVWTVDAIDPVDALNTCVSTMNAALDEPLTVGDDEVRLALKIGLATETLVAGGDLLGAARDALQSAREAPDARAVYYDQSMEDHATSGLRLAKDLRHAIEHHELRLHYQPIMDFATNEIVGAEALVRWERPGVGLLAPGDFIDAAERTGQIIPLGNWVMRTACNNAQRLGSHSGGPRTMSINVSARQLRDPNLFATLREAMVEGDCAPATIVVEVTESVLLHDLKTVATTLQEIKALNVGLDLDDFGTGYSSLQYLRNLPIDRIKVDQGFVAGLGVNGADTAIVASTIALAHALGLKAIAEGVETTQQLILLREMGCDYAQGYLLSRPTDMESFTTWLDAYIPAEVLPTAAVLLQERIEAADRRESEADRRESKADRRETNADRRQANADRRDNNANFRDTAASERDSIADERDSIADDRDHDADEREHSENGRESAGGSPDEHPSNGDSQFERDSAENYRNRATADREIKTSERARAGKGRDDASTGRTGEANARMQDEVEPLSGGDVA